MALFVVNQNQITPSVLPEELQKIEELLRKEFADRSLSIEADILDKELEIVITRHPVVPDVLVVTFEFPVDQYGYMRHFIRDGEQISWAADMWHEDDPVEFFSAKIKRDPDSGRLFWEYPDFEGKPDSIRWYCYDEQVRKSDAPGDWEYAPSKFQEGEEVWPIQFIGNVPGGWRVSNKDGTISEYWQCE